MVGCAYMEPPLRLLHLLLEFYHAANHPHDPNNSAVWLHSHRKFLILEFKHDSVRLFDLLFHIVHMVASGLFTRVRDWGTRF